MEQHYTADELAEKLKVHVSTVFREARAGHLRSVVIGRSRRFPESAVEEWLRGTENERSVASIVEMRGRRR